MAFTKSLLPLTLSCEQVCVHNLINKALGSRISYPKFYIFSDRNAVSHRQQDIDGVYSESGTHTWCFYKNRQEKMPNFAENKGEGGREGVFF